MTPKQPADKKPSLPSEKILKRISEGVKNIYRRKGMRNPADQKDNTYHPQSPAYNPTQEELRRFQIEDSIYETCCDATEMQNAIGEHDNLACELIALLSQAYSQHCLSVEYAESMAMAWEKFEAIARAQLEKES